MSMEFETLVRGRRDAPRAARLWCWLWSMLLLCATADARAQNAPAPPPPTVPEAPPSPSTAAAPEAAAPAAPAAPTSPEAARLDAARALGAQLLELEQNAQQLELERSRIRLKGPRIGKIVSWVASALFLSSAFSAWGRAEGVDEALKDGRDDEAYDTNGDGEVDQDDEQRSRRMSRALLGASVLPIGAGVFATMLEVRRRKQHRTLGYQLEDLGARRRALLKLLNVQLGAAPGHADLRLRLAF
jgi:hypothetical protein